MLKRINIYCREMFPIIPRLLLALILFFEIYFIILLNNGITNFTIGIEEFIGGFTVFSFLLLLRIADDFKDYEHDCRLFSHRPLPSNRVYKKDLKLFLIVLISITALLNIVFMNNVFFFILLYTYGFFMAMWFFQKHKIQKSLPLALITHNPVQIILNIYVISYTCIKYAINPFSLVVVLTCFTLYFPALIWEITRKIRAPKEETEYVTYSKLFGYQKAVHFVMILAWLDIFTNFLLVWNINKYAIIALLINIVWISMTCIRYCKNPYAFKILPKMERYTYIQEIIMLLIIPLYMIIGRL